MISEGSQNRLLPLFSLLRQGRTAFPLHEFSNVKADNGHWMLGVYCSVAEKFPKILFPAATRICDLEHLHVKYDVFSNFY